MTPWNPTIDYTIEHCIADLIETLEIERDMILAADRPEDELHEFVDSHVPVYNCDRVACLWSDLTLAEPEDPGLLPEGGNVFDTLGVTIFERLSAEAHSWLAQAQNAQAESEADDS